MRKRLLQREIISCILVLLGFLFFKNIFFRDYIVVHLLFLIEAH